MPAIIKGKKQQITDDLAQAKKLKPRLRKFVIDSQVRAAAKTVREQAEQREAILSHGDVLARRAARKDRLLHTPPLETVSPIF